MLNTATRTKRGSVTENTENTENAEAICSAFSALSVTSSLDELISVSTPRHEGERNAMILRLARGLRFNLGMAGRSLTELKPIVRQWHTRALPFIGTKDFDTSWSEFCNAWKNARCPLGDVAELAWQESLTAPPPTVASGYDSEPVRQLVCWCAALARMSRRGNFFLSTHTAARKLGVEPMQVYRWFKMLEDDKVIIMTNKGIRNVKAARYRWLGAPVPAKGTAA